MGKSKEHTASLNTLNMHAQDALMIMDLPQRIRQSVSGIDDAFSQGTFFLLKATCT